MLEEVRDRALQIAETSGRAYLSVLFPRDFEFYFCSLELCSFKGELIDYFSFPVLPNTVQKKEPYVVNIKKTFGGITVIKNSDFIPQDLSLKGNFGRSFKILDTKTNASVNLSGVSKYPDSKSYSIGTFSNIIKTGYGAMKYLQGILERSKIFDGDAREPRVLLFHNSPLGESYMVEPTMAQFDQSLASNMIWNYNINFSIIRSLDYGKDRGTSFLNNTVQSKQKDLLKSSVMSTVSGDIIKTLVNSTTSLIKLDNLL